MQIAVGLGLPSLDRSLFGFKKVDRSLTNSSQHAETSSRDEIQAPELPPLGMLNGNNSFANLLDHLDDQKSSMVNIASAQSPSVQITPVTPASATSSSSTLQPHDEKILQPNASMEFVTSGNYLSKLAIGPSIAVPERQQSNSTCASYSKRSETSSAGSASSRSSIDEVPAKSLSYNSPCSTSPLSLNTNFLNDGFQDIELHLELTPISIAVTPIISPNTNKPLPPAPLGGLLRYSIPELESAPVLTRTRHDIDGHREKPLSPNAKSRITSSVRPSTSSLESSPGTEDPPEPPRRNSARLRQRMQKSSQDIKKRVSADLPERIVFGILRNLTSMTDLKSAALVNKGFYRHFKRHESTIVESVLQQESPAAWELRRLVKREQRRNPFQMKAIKRDLDALRALQAFMMMRCGRICRKSTLDGLAGDNLQRRAAIENALWKIWTFCKLFGKGTSRDTGIHVQMMWLEGNPVREKGERPRPPPSKSNKRVSRSELEDMSEMWRCMEILLCGFRGREEEAREAGIFDQCSIHKADDKTETQHLEDWIYDILSVGPKAVLTMISCSFEHAKVLGVTKWTPPRQGKSRRSFLKAALEQVYRDRLVEEARFRAEDLAKQMQQHAVTSPPPSYSPLPSPLATQSSPDSPRSILKRSTTYVEQKPVQVLHIEIRPDCDPEASLPNDEQNGPTTSPTTNPAAFSSLAMSSNVSTRLGATLFPVHHDTNALTRRSQSSVSDTDAEDSIDQDLLPKVVDPTDRALSLLVKQLGFQETLAKQALAMSDDGAGIDVQRAVELLSSDRRLDSRPKDASVSELPADLSNLHPLPALQEVKEYCEGTCRRVSLLHRRKSNLRGLINRSSFRQNSPLSVILDREDEDIVLHRLTKHGIIPTKQSMPTVQEGSTEPKTGYHNLAEFIRYRSSIRSLNNSNSPGSSFLKGHKKSSSTGTIDFAEGTTNDLLSSGSPFIPASSLGGFMAIRSLSHQDYGTLDDEATNFATRPKATLMRVGTGRRPSKRISLTKAGLTRPGEPPEIIGYTY